MIAEWVNLHSAAVESVGYDIIVVLLLVRTVLSLAIATVFFIEPRKCGGSNRVVHWTLATVFMLGAWSSFSRATARMMAMFNNTGRLPATGALLWSEIAIVSVELVLLFVVIYQEFNARTKEQFKLNARCVECDFYDDCPKSIVEGVPNGSRH